MIIVVAAMKKEIDNKHDVFCANFKDFQQLAVTNLKTDALRDVRESCSHESWRSITIKEQGVSPRVFVCLRKGHIFFRFSKNN